LWKFLASIGARPFICGAAFYAKPVHLSSLKGGDVIVLIGGLFPTASRDPEWAGVVGFGDYTTIKFRFHTHTGGTNASVLFQKRTRAFLLKQQFPPAIVVLDVTNVSMRHFPPVSLRVF
jgi:hypothetical protein